MRGAGTGVRSAMHGWCPVASRWPAQLPVQRMRTYQIAAPVATHYRPASCVEVDCDAYLNGWVTELDESTADGQMMAGMLRAACRPTSGPASPGMRRYVESRTEAGLTRFDFPAGQPCFRSEADAEARHVVPLERPELYIVRGGDWRQHLGVEHRHTAPEFWLEDFAGNQQRLADRLGRG